MVSASQQSGVEMVARQLTLDARPFSELSEVDIHMPRRRLVELSGETAFKSSLGILLPSSEMSLALLENLVRFSESVGHIALKITVDEDFGCWALPLLAEYDSKNRARYPTVTRKADGAKGVIAHRYMWRLLVDPSIPTKQHLDHLCRAHACCNITHLEPVTPGINTQRGNLARTYEGGQVPLFYDV